MYENRIRKIRPENLLDTPDWGNGVFTHWDLIKKTSIAMEMIPLTLSSDYSVWKLRSRVGGRELATVLWTPDISHLPIASAEISPPDPQKVYPSGFIHVGSSCICRSLLVSLYLVLPFCSAASGLSHLPSQAQVQSRTWQQPNLCNCIFSRSPTGFFIWPPPTLHSHHIEIIFAFLSASKSFLKLSGLSCDLFIPR